MQSAEFVLALLIAVAALVTLARRLGVAYPIFLVIGGLALGLIPGVPRIEVDPDVIFLLVLPPILYLAAFFTPLRSLRANLGAISSLAVGLVIATALAVAVVAHALIPGITWPVALALGAIVSPPDEVAATQVAARLAVPRSILSILEGESLLNDATALTIYRAALAAAAVGTFAVASSLGTFAVTAIGGLAIGLAVGWLIAQVRSRLEDTPVEITISLLTPYAAFLPAEALGVSGVIATVVTGIYVGRRSSKIMGADTRLAGRAVWEMITFLLNGFVFILTGLEVPQVLSAAPPSAVLQLVAIGIVITIVAVLVRAGWIFGGAYLPSLLRRRRPKNRLRFAHSLVLSWAGMRGVVSLAIVLALPIQLSDGTLFPAREAIVVVTLTVIVLTLVGQGLTLPGLIRTLHLGTDETVREEETNAKRALVEAASRRIDELYPVWPGHRPLLDQLRTSYAHRSEHVERQAGDGSGEEGDRELIEHREIRRNVIGAEREALLRLRSEGAIDDDVLRSLERDLDLEEQRMDA
ncbi:MAG: Na+/H+ antiporter [Chloroflexi bacterium 13_1_40CM_4_68_4]|nr:MAG: Na+/H+ antiporter [Chloroflexi bacterium 13_1_40CM_4_68_4]